MNTKYLNQMLALICALLLGVANKLFAEEPPVSYEDAKKAAYSYARQFWGAVKVGNGIIFANPVDQLIAGRVFFRLNRPLWLRWTVPEHIGFKERN